MKGHSNSQFTSTPACNRKARPITRARWVAYAAAGAATALIKSNSAEAAIHYSGILNVRLPVGREETKSFQLDQPGDFFVLKHTSYEGRWRAFFTIYGIVSHAFNGPSVTHFGYGWGYASKLRSGQRIWLGPFFSKTFQGFGPGLLAYFGFSHEQWTDFGKGFVGFRFNSGAGMQYGWARLKVAGLPQNDFELIDYAYGDPGEPVRAGQASSDEQAPDQGSLGWLALGAVGLLAWRKSRSQARR
ncbi:MAG TPA: hypothetical protein VGI60_03715 [Chthoniobacterales bacterium]